MPTACPEIKNTKITGNGYAGVGTYADASPVLGNASTGQGMNNSIDNPQYNVNQDAGSSVMIMAENCWWGAMLPHPMKIVGNIDYDPFLSSEPQFNFFKGGGQDSSTRVMLAQNYPNPFNRGGSTTIRYSIPAQHKSVSIIMYDVAGRRVRTLVNREHSRGTHYIAWDGCNERGAKVAPGIYFYRMVVGDRKITKKIIMLR